MPKAKKIKQTESSLELSMEHVGVAQGITIMGRWEGLEAGTFGLASIRGGEGLMITIPREVIPQLVKWLEGKLLDETPSVSFRAGRGVKKAGRKR